MKNYNASFNDECSETVYSEEIIAPADPDFELIKQRKNDASFIPLDVFLCHSHVEAR